MLAYGVREHNKTSQTKKKKKTKKTTKKQEKKKKKKKQTNKAKQTTGVLKNEMQEDRKGKERLQ